MILPELLDVNVPVIVIELSVPILKTVLSETYKF
jgi:hypothetical protein